MYISTNLNLLLEEDSMDPKFGNNLRSSSDNNFSDPSGSRFSENLLKTESDGSINFHRVPANALGVRSRSELSKYLNPDHMVASNWKFLAEELGYSFLEIQNYERARNPTEAVLYDWSSKEESSIGMLLDKIKEIERDDILRDLSSRIESDVDKWVKRKLEESARAEPVQVPEVTASQQELRGITLNDDREGFREKFDAYVCYTTADLEFVHELIQNLEQTLSLKLCVNDRDLVPGASNATVTAELIERRCRKMLVILSPEFLQDSLCDFAVRFAISLEPNARSKRVIPIMYRSCKMPSIMNHLTVCDFTKRDLRKWFWPRLQKAVQNK